VLVEDMSVDALIHYLQNSPLRRTVPRLAIYAFLKCKKKANHLYIQDG